MKKVLITGGAGFIGVNLARHLSQTGEYEILAIDNGTMGRLEDLEAINIPVVRGDILDEALLDEVLQGIEIVVHLAADTRVMDSIVNPAFNFSNNVIASFKLLEGCRKHAVKKVIAASTGGAILGDAPAPVHEEMVAKPLAPYGASKLAMEGYMSAFSGAYGISGSALRFSNIYGPYSYHKGSVVAHFFKKILNGEPLKVFGDGTQMRDYLFVTDLVAGIQKAMDDSSNGVFQLGSGRPTSINELIDLIAEITGTRPGVEYLPFRDGEIYQTWCDIKKSTSTFNYSAPTKLLDGLKETWEWFKINNK